MSTLSVHRRAVKMRWPKSYRDGMVHGDGRWLSLEDRSGLARDHAYGGFIWTYINMFATRLEAENDAKPDKNYHKDYLVRREVVDCETLSTFRRAQGEQSLVGTPLQRMLAVGR